MGLEHTPYALIARKAVLQHCSMQPNCIHAARTPSAVVLSMCVVCVFKRRPVIVVKFRGAVLWRAL